MALVTGYTKEHTDEIFAEDIVDGSVVGDNLILEKRSGATVNAGNVRGATGAAGATGATGAAGSNGVAQMIMPPSELFSPGSVLTADTYIAPAQDNVPTVIGRLYEFRVELEFGVANFYSGGATPRWDFWVARNTILLKKFARLEDNQGGAYVKKVSGSIFWIATTVGDDFNVFCDHVVTGMAIQRTDSRASMAVIDWGTP